MTMWCDRGLVRCSFYYGLATTEKDYHAELRRMKVAEKHWAPFISNAQSDATVHWLANTKEGKPAAIVCIRVTPGRTGLEIAGLLVHEAVHLWQAFRKDIGELEPSSEFEAYSIQVFAQELMRQYREQTKRRHKVTK